MDRQFIALLTFSAKYKANEKQNLKKNDNWPFPLPFEIKSVYKYIWAEVTVKSYTCVSLIKYTN